MPYKSPRVCPKCHKAHTTPRGCPTCDPAWKSGGYTGSGSTRQGRRMRERQLADYPICQTLGCKRLACEVDHIENVTAGGGRYDEGNLQSLCKPHHDAKTSREALAGRQRAAAPVELPDEPMF